jgi:hypothetical protein
MSINLGTYALVSALAVGGAVAQYQYSQPAGPPDPNTTTGQNVQPGGQSSPAHPGPPMGTATDPIDCNTLMTNHQQMMQELNRLDSEVDTRISQMKDAQSDKAKLEATAGVVEVLAAQRKQIRDRMMSMEHQTFQFMLTNKSQDLASSCPQLTELQYGSTHGQQTTPGRTEQGGPNDLELGNDATASKPNDDTKPKDNVTKPNDQDQH